MANKPITMNKIRQILRLYTQSKGKKFISSNTGVARNTVKKYISIFKELRKTFRHELDFHYNCRSEPTKKWMTGLC